MQILCVLALGAPIAAVRAAPLDDPFVGGLSFNGPTSGDLAAVYWNPAALGLVRGFQVMVAGTARLTHTTANLTGAGSASSSDVTQPLQWPPGPGGFLALSTDFGSDRVTLAFATYEPFVEQAHFAADSAARFYRIDADLRNLALVPALAVRFGSDFRIGLAPGFLLSTGRLRFSEPTAGGEAIYDVNSGQSILESTVSYTLGAGLYYRRRGWEFGLSYSSRPLGSDVGGVEVAGGGYSAVTSPGGAPLTCSNGQSVRCAFGDAVYRLPDVWIAGVSWHPRPGLEISATERWLWFHLQDRIDIRFTSPALDPAGLPEHIVFYRGQKDVWDTRVRVAYWIRERVRVGAALRVETSAVGASDVNPAEVDGLKFEPMVLCEVRASRKLSFTAGYGFSYMPSVTVNASSFDSGFDSRCVAAGQGIDDPNCIARNAGRDHPSADGTYSRTEQDFSLAMTARF